MKIRLAGLAVVALLASGASAQAQSPLQDSVNGFAIVGPFDDYGTPNGTPVTINAASNADGTNPQGRIDILVGCDLNGDGCTSHFNQAGGDVTCLNVHGNRAIIGYYGLLRGSSVDLDQRVRGLVEVIDGGPPNPTSPRDTLNYLPLYIEFFYPDTPDLPITKCPDQLPAEPPSGYPLPSGPLVPALRVDHTNSPQDFAVVDAEPTVSCGQVITQDTTLEHDLVDCPGNGLVIGADNITLDLNGHTVDGLRGANPCEPDCLHGRGIDNTAGHDGVRIINGKVTDFERGVILVSAERNVLKGLTASANSTREVFSPVSLIRSDHNTVVDNTMGGGEPALLLFLSDDNTVARNQMGGGISIRGGDGVALVQADHNRLVDNQTRGNGAAVRINDSVGNRLARNTVGGDLWVSLMDVRRTRVIDNTFAGGRGGVRLSGDDNVLRRNTATATHGTSIDATGNRNQIIRNTILGGGSWGIAVGTGTANLVKRNSVSGGTEGIRILSTATATRLIANSAERTDHDGIHVEAPGTRIQRNTANNNGNLGIEAVPGVIDLGGNKASGNGNPLQCVNVFCQ